MRAAVAVAAAALLAACSVEPASARSLVLHTLDGQSVTPLTVAAGQLRVLIFVAHDCPIANSYAPAIEQLWRELRGSEIDCLLVFCDADFDADAARRHAAEYALTIPIALDPEQRLARELGAHITPEAALLDADGLVYRGRIDDRWRGLGKDSQVAEREDLRCAIAERRAGRAVSVPRTTAIGCRLPWRDE